MTQTSTPKFVEEVVVEVMKVDKTTMLFQTMAIVCIVMMIQKGNDKMFGKWSNKLQNEDKRIVVNVVHLQI
jgi:hypothetical protein